MSPVQRVLSTLVAGVLCACQSPQPGAVLQKLADGDFFAGTHQTPAEKQEMEDKARASQFADSFTREDRERLIARDESSAGTILRFPF